MLHSSAVKCQLWCSKWKTSHVQEAVYLSLLFKHDKWLFNINYLLASRPTCSRTFIETFNFFSIICVPVIFSLYSFKIREVVSNNYVKTCVEKVSLKYDFRVAPCHGHTHLTSSYRPNSGGTKENQSFETNGLSRVKLN